MNTVIGQRR